MHWQEVSDDPLLQDLPFKIELNRFGKIVMSPALNWRGILPMRIGAKLMGLIDGGQVISECSIETAEKSKVADVAWASTAFIAMHGTTTPYQSAPEICVEILPPPTPVRK